MRYNAFLHFCTFALLILSVSSCTDDLAREGVEEFDGSQLTRGYSDEQIKLQRLGYAYNAAGNVMDDSSFSTKPIINMTRLTTAEATYGPIISSERRHYTSMDIFSGNTLEELGNSENNYTINDNGVAGCGEYYRENSIFSHTTWHNSYKVHMFAKHIMATKTIDAGMLRCLNLDDLSSSESVLEADFRKEVAQLVSKGQGVTEADATQFSKKYGTHLVVSSNLGGMIELQMEIKRDSCVDVTYVTTQVCEVVLGKQVVTTSSPSKVYTKIGPTKVEYKGQIQVKGGKREDCNSLHRTFDETKAEAVKLGDGDYYGWAKNISIEPDGYNAAFTGGRFLPLYELFEDNATRTVLRRVYELYMKQSAPTQEIYEPDYGVLSLEGNYGPDVRVASSGTDKACIVCQEYVPSIRSDKPCVVVYPLIRDNTADVRPFFFSGFFIGDETHRPGRVAWKGSNSVYVPSDSIYYDSDSLAIRNLFDTKTHALKQVYFYWNAIHPTPCPTKDESPKAYTTSIFKLRPAALSDSTTFAKVASTFWSVRPVVLNTDNLTAYWGEDPKFTQFKSDRYSQYGGVLYKDTNHNDAVNNKYFYCLIDGGDNFKRVPGRTDDNEGDKQWTDAVSQSVKAIGLNDYLPSVLQSKSITQMLGNRMSVFYTPYYNDDRNMLGLDWPTGYWSISHPSQQSLAVVPTKSDGQGIPVITNDVGQACILRLSGSGTDRLLDYPEYVRAFNFSEQDFFKYFPIYITIEKF